MFHVIGAYVICLETGKSFDDFKLGIGEIARVDPNGIKGAFIEAHTKMTYDKRAIQILAQRFPNEFYKRPADICAMSIEQLRKLYKELPDREDDNISTN